MGNQRIIILSLFCILSILFYSNNILAQEETSNWTDYRGPNKNGISTAQNIPTSWSDSTNVTWKTEIPGRGWSSPVIFNDKIWLTTALQEGKKLRLLSVNANSGEILQDLLLFERDSLQEQHPLNSFASPTAALEKDRVYAHFGAYGTACVDTESGKKLWERTDLHCEHEVGPGSSPFLYKDLLILTFDGTDVRFLVALNKYTGKTVWKINRDVDVEEYPEPNRKAFTTPIISEIDGIEQLISVGPHSVMGYKPLSGEQIWKAYFKGFSGSARPIVANNMLFKTVAIHPHLNITSST